MKRFLSVLLTFCLLLSIVVVPVSAVTNDFGYGMEISGFEQSVDIASDAFTGLYSYNGYEYPVIPAAVSSGYYLFLQNTLSSIYLYCYDH